VRAKQACTPFSFAQIFVICYNRGKKNILKENINFMKLSVVIPAYNEEKRIAATLQSIDQYLEKQNFDYEIIVVVNNTKDRTFEVVTGLQTTTVQKLIAMNLKEAGKGNAVKRGILEKATGDIVMFMDADNATPVSEISKFLPHFEQGYDVVIGSRELNPELVKVEQTFKRKVLGYLSHLLVRIVLLPGIYDSQTGFKAFTGKAAQEIFSRVTILGWAFDMEVLGIARARGLKIKEVGVSWTEFGGSHVPLSAFVTSLIDLFRIKLRKIVGRYSKE
jgi:dolichyl-phosphate beta-glucosyltransferase